VDVGIAELRLGAAKSASACFIERISPDPKPHQKLILARNHAHEGSCLSLPLAWRAIASADRFDLSAQIWIVHAVQCIKPRRLARQYAIGKNDSQAG